MSTTRLVVLGVAGFVLWRVYQSSREARLAAALNSLPSFPIAP